MKATFLGPKRITPTEEDLRSVDAEVSLASQESGADKYTTALALLWHATRGMAHGFTRLAPLQKIRPPKQQRPVIDEVSK